MAKPLRVGIIGFGLSGKYFHLPLLTANPNYRVDIVCTSRAEDVAAAIPGAKVVRDSKDLISDPEIDLVINCAPNSQHYDLSAQALENGKHVVVEKPFVNTLQEGERLIRLAEERGKILSVFQNRRWDGDFLTAADLIRSGKLGQVLQYESHMDRFRPHVRSERWREQDGPGSGILFDLGSHLIDQAVVLFGRPQSVVADRAKQRAGALADDYFHIVMKYETLRVILHSTSFADTTPRFQVFGEHGSYTKFGLDPQEDQMKSGMKPGDDRFGRDREEQYGILFDRAQGVKLQVPTKRGSYGEFYSQLFEAISGRGPNPVPASEALEVIRLIEGCL